MTAASPENCRMIPAIRRMLVPIDFSAGSNRATDYAIVMAAALGASVHLLHVVEAAFVREAHWNPAAPETPALRLHAIRDGYRKLAASATRFSESGGRVTTEVRSGRAPREIVAVAHSRGMDLIVMGTHGRTGLYHVMHGSVAHHVVRNAPCPVLAVCERSMDDTPVTAVTSAVRAS